MLKVIANKLISNSTIIESNLTMLGDINLESEGNFVKYEKLLTNINEKIDTNNKFVNNLEKFTTTINTVCDILTSLPIPTAPFGVTVGMILTMSDKLSYLRRLSAEISSYLTTFKKISNTQGEQLITYQNVLANDLGKSTIYSKNSDVISNVNQLVLKYNNYDIYIKEDFTGFYNRYYAVAYKNGEVVIRTDSSHLTNTEILLDKIKFLLSKI